MRCPQKLTVADCLVATACVAVLLVTVGAVGRQGRERAKRAVCLGNLTQLTQTWRQFADDHNGNLVNGDTGEYVEGHINETPWVLPDWSSSMTVAEKEQAIRQGALFPYAGDSRLYKCPLGGATETRSYAVVDSMNGHDWFSQVMIKSLEEIQHADQRFVFIDDGGTPQIALGGWTCYPDGTERRWDPPPIRHNDGTTLSFADGHVEYRQWEDPRTIEFGRETTAFSELQPGNDDIRYMYVGVWGQTAQGPTDPTGRR
jgi:prepilin-type processing-associated H-X9-DG protein